MPTRRLSYENDCHGPADGDVKDPPSGRLELDIVCHGGQTMAGLVHSCTTVVLTHHACGWTESVALIARDGGLVLERITSLRARLPLLMRGLDSDNGSEFINE